MLMEITFPKIRELLVMMTTMISPFERDVPRQNHSAGRQKWSYPTSASRRLCFVPKVLTFFFLSQNDTYTKRWASWMGLEEHNPSERAWTPWRAQVGCAHLIIDSYISYIFQENFSKVSVCLKLCRIDSLTQFFHVQISSCRNSFSLCISFILWEKY